MARVVVFAVALVLASSTVGLASADESVVTTKYGPVRGTVAPQYRNWQGIPFAAPPLGHLRWKNPIEPEPWTDVKDCTNFTIACAQLSGGLDVPWNKSEDCLYLEMWAPRAGVYSTGAAVMVFFHGGDFKEGGESFAIYHGAYQASIANTIVIVTNYRLGVLGFLHTPVTDVNVGIEDQRFVLQWVQQNIAYFGGDPTKVTIFGQSAGGQSVLIHLATPEAYSAKMFSAAIVESGPSLGYRDASAANQLTDTFMRQLKCHERNLTCLQTADVRTVLEAADKCFEVPLSIGAAVQKWAPVINGNPQQLPKAPTDAFAAGEIVKVPLMIGSNLDDGALFGYAMAPWNSTCHCNNIPLASVEYEAIVLGITRGSHLTEVLKAYPPDKQNNQEVLSQLITDYLFLCSSRYFIRKALAAGIASTYLYQFTHQPPFCPWPSSQEYCCNKVCHGDEMPYLFHDSGLPFPWVFPETPDDVLSASVARYWASFAHFADPNQMLNQTLNVPNWPKYDVQSDLNMQLDWPLTINTELHAAKCAIWDKIGYDN
eukprot:TRINITY_DN3828_c0_g1_i1.p1 TRINITY_DN3828_c0_g1~~TRINITY_DN3828_c0_g1_i1.p1  ORF type:complete len:551 (-),score=181.87 TRINITY_DN3828_c0_g1_i1:181-1803(-)